MCGFLFYQWFENFQAVRVDHPAACGIVCESFLQDDGEAVFPGEGDRLNPFFHACLFLFRNHGDFHEDVVIRS